jgi:hypothetical protein
MRVSRPTIAVIIGLLVALAVVTPLVWLIKNRDWGVALMLLVPFVVYGLIRLGRILADWANPPPDLPTRGPKGGS